MAVSELDVLLGKRMKELRERSGLSLSEVASRLGMSKSSIHAYEKGKARLYWDTMIHLCRIYGVSYDDIATEIQVEYNSRKLFK